MKRTLLFLALAAAAAVSASPGFAATFTYHGVLQDAGKPAQGKYDIELTLYASPNGGSIIGGPLTLNAVEVRDGSFSTEADFGPLAKSFKNAYVGVKVRMAGTGDFTPLSNLEAVADANSGCPGSWSLDGNAGNPSNSFLGTTDTSDLVFKSQNTQVATAYVTTGGPYPSWAGGAFNFILGQGAFIGGGGASSSSDSTNSNGAYSFSVVGGGQKNRAGSSTASYGTVGGGISNMATATYATVAGGQSNQASGVAATVPGGAANLASGAHSFAAGQLADASNAGSFVWSDGTTAQLDSAPNEFDLRASGGMGINGTPKNSGIELSIYPSGLNGGNFSNMFYGLNGTNGILTSAGGASSSTANDASFYFDDFDGTHQTRIFSITPSGITVGGNINSSSVIMASAGASSEIFLNAHGSTSADLGFAIGKQPTGSGTATQFLNFGAAGELQIFNATAEKPGGGSWTATSDRRIKQDIAPIRDALDTIMKLRPVNFRYTPEYRAMEGGLADKPYAGFIAQEYRDVFPEAVMQTSKRVPGSAPGDPSILALDPNPAIITAVAAVQELAVENADLHHQIDELAARLAKLEARKGN